LGGLWTTPAGVVIPVQDVGVGSGGGDSRTGGTRGSSQPGPVYDAALRRMVELDPAAICRLLGVEIGEPPRILSAELPTATLSADLVLRVAADHLVDVEYMRTTAPDLVARMLVYRGLIMRTYPGNQLTQYVLVLGGGGRIRGHDDLARYGFALDLIIIYVRELDPAMLLEEPSLAPLAVLGRGSADDRAKAFSTATRLIRRHGGPEAGELLEFASRLAIITLDRPIIEGIIKEAGMSLEAIEELFGETVYGNALRKRLREEGIEEGREEGRAAGREEGRAAGREEGLTQARVEFLTALLKERFGDDPVLTAVANRLASWPDAATAVHAIGIAATLDALTATDPSA
jgi:hypothetical protein